MLLGPFGNWDLNTKVSVIREFLSWLKENETEMWGMLGYKSRTIDSWSILESNIGAKYVVHDRKGHGKGILDQANFPDSNTGIIIVNENNFDFAQMELGSARDFDMACNNHPSPEIKPELNLLIKKQPNIPYGCMPTIKEIETPWYNKFEKGKRKKNRY